MPLDQDLRSKVRGVLHALVQGEAEQIDNIMARRPRTDQGYSKRLDDTVSDVITLVHEHEKSHG